MTSASGAEEVDWLQQPQRSAVLHTIAHAAYMGGVTVLVDGVFERWARREWIGFAIVIASYAVLGVNGFLEARAGRWIAPAAYLADRARSWWTRLFRYAVEAAIWAACWAAAESYLRGLSLSNYPAYLNWFLPGFVGVFVTFRVASFLFRGWCEGISARAPQPAPTTWLVRPQPVVTWGRRAVGFCAIAVACGALLYTARPMSKAASVLQKVMLGAVVATFVCAGQSRAASAKHGATQRVVQ